MGIVPYYVEAVQLQDIRKAKAEKWFSARLIISLHRSMTPLTIEVRRAVTLTGTMLARLIIPKADSATVRSRLTSFCGYNYFFE